jgi:hypothetical protein
MARWTFPIATLIAVATIPASLSAADAPVAKVWQEYVDAKKAGAVPPLPDFSYAGYHAGEDAIPDVQGPVFDVTKHGAKPDDGADDQAGIQKAVDAAEQAGGGVVFLPAGTYDVNTDINHRRPLRIRKSGIVLRGAGMNQGGTVIRIDQPTVKLSNENDNGIGCWLQVGPEPGPPPPAGEMLAPDEKIGEVVADAPRDSRVLTLSDASGANPGMWVTVRIGKSEELARQILAPYKLEEVPDGWTRIRDGVGRSEHHKVEAVDGNKVTLREPLLTHVDGTFGWALHRFSPIENVGVEDISFQGSWVGKFNHHRSWMDDNGWDAVKFTRVADGWMRRCAVVNTNSSIGLESCAHMTLLHNVLAGQMGHSSIGNPRRCTNLLIGLSLDDMKRNGSFNTTHGIGSAGSGAAVVYWRYDMADDESFDFHGMWPYATLFDAVTGGDLNNSGGPIPSFPNHAELFVGWNFKHTYEPKYRNKKEYSFWGGNPRPTMVKPIFVGTHGVPVKFDEKTLGLNESQGTAVSPESLWEAQVRLKRGGSLPAWVEEARSTWAAMNKEPAPFPSGGDNTPWVAAKRAQTIQITMATPMVKDRYDKDDAVQFLVNEWPTADGSPFPPYFDQISGENGSAVKVRILGGNDEQVRYTLDGTEPTEKSPVYEQPIEIKKRTTVKATAFKPGHAPSRIASGEFDIKIGGATAAADVTHR